MNIYLYKNKSDKRSLHKELVNEQPITNVEIFTPCNVLTPSLFIEAFSGVTEYNYCFIPEFNRYYYFTVTLENKKAILNCSVDVLMSNSNNTNKDFTIENLETVVKRNEFHKFTNVVDPQIQFYNSVFCKGANYGNVICDNSNGQFVLITR